MATKNEPGCGAVLGWIVLGIILLGTPFGRLLAIIGVLIWIASKSSKNNISSNSTYVPKVKSTQKLLEEEQVKREKEIKKRENEKSRQEEKRKREYRKKALQETIENCENATRDLVHKYKNQIYNEKLVLETQNPYKIKNENAWFEVEGKGFDFFYKKVFQSADFYPVFIDSIKEMENIYKESKGNYCKEFLSNLCKDIIKEESKS